MFSPYFEPEQLAHSRGWVALNERRATQNLLSSLAQLFRAGDLLFLEFREPEMNSRSPAPQFAFFVT
ncbi:MAG: hypothetical protein DMG60_18950 [Acidobacteria bacterium]|nr:MAG: hypothetical protein DMG60_18950 [Acidobacteriota bacterium]